MEESVVQDPEVEGVESGVKVEVLDMLEVVPAVVVEVVSPQSWPLAAAMRVKGGPHLQQEKGSG